jgi:hypothetical protein
LRCVGMQVQKDTRFPTSMKEILKFPKRGSAMEYFKIISSLKLLQEVLRRTNPLLSLMRHGPHWKRRVRQFFYCCVCIR